MQGNIAGATPTSKGSYTNGHAVKWLNLPEVFFDSIIDQGPLEVHPKVLDHLVKLAFLNSGDDIDLPEGVLYAILGNGQHGLKLQTQLYNFKKI